MERNTLHLIDYTIIAVSLLLSIGVGFRFSKKQQSTGDYFKAGGKIPSWAIGISILATLVSSITFLAYPGAGYASNWILLVQGLMVPVVLIVMIWFIVPLYRKVIGLSVYEYFEKRFGYPARLYGSVGFVLNIFCGMSTTLFLLALAVSEMTHTSTFLILWIIGITFIVITLMGGMEGVIWLDVIQGFLLILGGLVCLFILIFSISGGLPEIWRVAAANHKTGFGPYDIDFSRLTFIVIAINGVFYAIQKYATDQTMVQRYLTACTDRSAIKATLMGAFLTVPVWMLFMFIGTALFVFYHLHPGSLPGDTRPDGVFPHFIMSELPPGIVGLVISALLAAAISTVVSGLNSLVAVGIEDFYKRWQKDRPDKHYLKVSKLLVVLAGLFAVLASSLYLFTGDEGVLEIIFILYAIFSGGIAGIFLLGFFVPRANKEGLYIAMVACILFTTYAVLTSTTIGSGANEHLILDLGNFNFTQNKLMLGVYTHLIILGVGWAASYFFPVKEVNSNLLYYGWKEAKNKEHLNHDQIMIKEQQEHM